MIRKNPFIGPQPFQLNQKNIFYGRDDESNELLSYIIAHQAVLLYAQSGAGKTSLLNAGLIPLLATEEFKVLDVARVGILDIETPGMDINNVYVYNTLMSWEKDNLSSEALMNTTIQEYLGTEDYPRVIIFDQFEELFTTFSERWKDRNEFIRQIGEALDNDPLLRVIFSMREDYLAFFDPISDYLPENLRTRFRLERLSYDAALMAVKNPVEQAEIEFNNEAAKQLVNELLKIQVEVSSGKRLEVIGEYVEPVQLQLVCMNLWQKLPEGTTTITKEHVDALSDIDLVLTNFYDEAIKEAAISKAISERDLRRTFESVFITEIGTRGTVHRGQNNTGGLPNSVIDFLEMKHLIRAERRSGARWFELTHDRFISPIQKSNKEFNIRRIESSSSSEGDKLIKQARIERDAGDTEKALTYYQDALKIFEKYEDLAGVVDTSYAIGYLMHDMGRLDESIHSFSRAIELLPIYPYSYAGRGTSYWYAGELEKAEADLTMALMIKGDSVDIDFLKLIYHNRGQILAEMGRYSEAEKDLRTSIQMKQEYGLNVDYARNGLALALGGQGKYEESMEEFEKAIEEHPDNAWVYFNRATIHLQKGDYANAISDFQVALQKENPALNQLKIERSIQSITELQAKLS